VPMPPIESFVTTDDGVGLFVRAVGDGPRTVVVPNGFHLVDDFAFLARDRRLVVYDVRNRGRSEPIRDSAKLVRGIENDVDDLDAARRHLGADTIDLIGHSYIGLMIAVYAMRYGTRVRRAVQIGPSEMTPGRAYPAHLSGDDDIRRDIFARLGELQKE